MAAGARRWCWLAAVAAWCMVTMPTAHADTLATYRDGARAILLMTQKCRASGGGQRAQVHSKGSLQEGCWRVNARGNPVVRWRDGRRQELQASRVRLTPAYAALLNEPDTRDAAAASADVPAGGFPRAAWCKDATFPHERLVCRDPELAAADLALSPLWRSYRETVGPLEQARVKSDYFRRLKRCGAHKACIAGEQAAQARFYRRALATG